jgi:hypothetical protein
LLIQTREIEIEDVTDEVIRVGCLEDENSEEENHILKVKYRLRKMKHRVYRIAAKNEVQA